MKLKALVSNFFIRLKEKGALPIFISTFLVKFATFFGSFFLIRILSKNDFGVFSYFETIYGYLYLVAGLGLSHSIFRFVVIAKGLDKKKQVYRFCIRIGTIINLAVVLVAALVFAFVPFAEPYCNYVYIIIVLTLMVPFKYIVDCNLYVHRSMFKPKSYAFWSILASFLYIFSKIIGALIFGLKGIVIFAIVTEALLCIFTFIFTSRKYFKDVPDNEILNKEEKKKSLSFGVQSMITNGLWTILMLNDIFILGRFFTDPSVVADYKAAIMIPQTFSLISNAIGLIVGPYFSKLENEGKIDEVKKLWGRSIIISTLFLLLIFGICFIFAKPIVSIICGKQYADVYTFMRLFLISSIINNAIRYTTANALSAMGAVKYNIIVSIIGLALQIGLDILFIPLYGITGVAFANIISYSVMAICIVVCYFIFISKRSKKAYEKK